MGYIKGGIIGDGEGVPPAAGIVHTSRCPPFRLLHTQIRAPVGDHCGLRRVANGFPVSCRCLAG